MESALPQRRRRHASELRQGHPGGDAVKDGWVVGEMAVGGSVAARMVVGMVFQGAEDGGEDGGEVHDEIDGE